MKSKFFLIGLLAAIWFSAAAPPASLCEDAMPDTFVHIEEIIPDALLDIRYFTEHNFLGVKVDGYLAPACILTRPAAEALARVQKDLAPFGMTIKIYDCYRPQRAVDHFVRWAKDVGDTRTKKEFYPTVDKQNLFRDGYIAERSGHSRGSTVDLTLVPLPAPIQPAYKAGDPLKECCLPAGFESRAWPSAFLKAGGWPSAAGRYLCFRDGTSLRSSQIPCPCPESCPRSEHRPADNIP